MPHSDTGAVTARALARISEAKGRAAKTLPPVNACEKLHHFKPDGHGDFDPCPVEARLTVILEADVPLLAAIAAAAIRYRQSEERHRAIIAADPKQADRLMDDASQTVMTDRAALDAAIRAAGEAGHA